MPSWRPWRISPDASRTRGATNKSAGAGSRPDVRAILAGVPALSRGALPDIRSGDHPRRRISGIPSPPAPAPTARSVDVPGTRVTDSGREPLALRNHAGPAFLHGRPRRVRPRMLCPCGPRVVPRGNHEIWTPTALLRRARPARRPFAHLEALASVWVRADTGSVAARGGVPPKLHERRGHTKPRVSLHRAPFRRRGGRLFGRTTTQAPGTRRG